MDKQEFIMTVLPGALDGYQKYGILPSLTIAQAIHESAWGDKHIANNLFGMKPGSTWKGEVKVVWTHEYVNGVKIKVQAAFRAYDNFAESVIDHNKLLGELSRYKRVREAQDYREACVAVQECGYATDPKYADKLIAVIETNDLTRYDDEVRIPDWAKASWTKAVAKGINDGHDPNKPVTEAQLMVFLDRCGLLD